MDQRAGNERVFVQCLPGLESVLQAEARHVGAIHPVTGGIELEGLAGVHAEAALVLRLAERVLLRLVEFSVRRWSEVEAGLASVNLEGVAGADAPVVVETSIRLAGAPPPRALVETLARIWRRPVEAARGEERVGEKPRLLLRVAEGKATLSADAGGELLHRRGWRQEISRAPLRETLAAGVLALARYAPEQPLRDVVCGSGTLVIEAALASRAVAPGLGRTFAAERWPRAERDDWSGRRDRLRAEVRPRAIAPIVGSDVNAGALGTARRNARRAGVLADLQLERTDVAAAVAGTSGPGLVVGNLPYGRRVDARGGLEDFDAALARTLSRAFPGWRKAFLVDDEARLARAAGRSPDRVHRLINGGLPVVLGVWEPLEGV
ncbi:MAG TPA: RNA methyltransferase [Myxococcaceae bacterium]|nr:RNA methyltransferase [Myxococcaceae bacterium]